ncbi:stalk domain-containing protein [Paenibacillus sp. UNC451MF]|uniref:stalk domain-containing protein n=1 Tax=Paenibacillus sp. UNC451MF TaxID=1449063 RepID=UPI000490921E|nr:stalk domain-containing protein [Paenibacillus sp. UNC451MF]
MKRWAISFMLVMSTVSPIVSTAYAEDAGVQVWINGAPTLFEQTPVIIDGTTLVPMYGLFQHLGASTQWEDSTQTIIASKNDTMIKMSVGSKKAEVSGEPKELEIPVRMVGGEPLVPIRFVSNALGMYVYWDEETRTVKLDSDDELNGRTKRQVDARIRASAPVFSGDVFEEKPHIAAPHKPGKLNTDFVEDGVKTVNLMRYLAGLPDDLAQDSALNEQAQYGAVLLADFGKLSHTPGKTSGMEEPFYKKGYLSTSTSNIYSIYAASSAIKLNGLLNRTVVSYMSDHDDTNRATVGHRRWILYPPLQKIGFGLAEGRRSNDYKTYFSPMQVFDKSRKATFDYDVITWPGKGYFPIKYFQGNDPWSVSLNPERFMKPSLDEVSVSLTRLNDDKIWTMDRDDLEKKNDSAYFNVDTSPYGVPYCIIFKPDAGMHYNDGDRFMVKVSGLKDRQGDQVSVSYQVVMFAT